MPCINQFMWDGNVTHDVQLGYLPSHTPVAVYSVAQTRVWFDGDQRREATDYLRVTTYGRQAECDAAHLTKGFKVTVVGHMRPWSKDGKSGVDFVADTVIYQNDVKSRRWSAMLGNGQEGALVSEHHAAELSPPTDAAST